MVINVLLNISIYLFSFWLFSFIQKKIAIHKLKNLYKQDSKDAEDKIQNFFNHYDDENKE